MWIEAEAAVTITAPLQTYSDDPSAPVVLGTHQDGRATYTFTVKGSVYRIAIGLGTKGNMNIPGGSGKMYIDDVRLNLP